MKYEIGDEVTDESGHYKGIVCIKWDDGDWCALENDAAHPNPRIVGHWDPKKIEEEEDAYNISESNKKPKKG